MTQFKNSNGSRTISCCSGNALLHWERNTGRKAKQCSVLGCTKKAEHGGHVINCHGNASRRQYIIPLCRKHNHHTFKDCYYINVGIQPIRVAKLSNCI